MAKAPYLPADDPGKAIWLNTFDQGINQPDPSGVFPTLGEALGLTAAEVTATGADALMFAFCIQNQDSFNTERQERTNYKNLARSGEEGTAMDPYPVSAVVAPPAPVPEGIFKRIPELVARIKASANYTTAIGEDLGIIGDEQVFDPNTLKPVITAQVLSTGVLIKWEKGFAEGLKIFADRGTGFHFLATDTQPDYLDTLAMPAEAATWIYRAVYVIDDEQVGQFSDEVEVQVQAAV